MTISHRGMNVCQICEASLLATTLCIWEIWSPRIHVSRISLLAKQKKKHVTALILKPTDDQKPETCLGGPLIWTNRKISQHSGKPTRASSWSWTGTLSTTWSCPGQKTAATKYGILTADSSTAAMPMSTRSSPSRGLPTDSCLPSVPSTRYDFVTRVG